MTTENKIKCVLIDFEINKISLQEATKQILLLLNVVERSEQLVCDCGNPNLTWYGNDDDKTYFCFECKKEVKNKDAVSFSIFDTVYMDSPFGRYTGIVKEVKDGKMTIESHSPTGKGMMLADYDIEGTEWKKY